MALPRCPVRGGSGNRSGTLRSRVAPAANHGHTGDHKPASYLSYDLHTAHTHTAHPLGYPLDSAGYIYFLLETAATLPVWGT